MAVGRILRKIVRDLRKPRNVGTYFVDFEVQPRSSGSTSSETWRIREQLISQSWRGNNYPENLWCCQVGQNQVFGWGSIRWPNPRIMLTAILVGQGKMHPSMWGPLKRVNNVTHLYRQHIFRSASSNSKPKFPDSEFLLSTFGSDYVYPQSTGTPRLQNNTHLYLKLKRLPIP